MANHPANKKTWETCEGRIIKVDKKLGCIQTGYNFLLSEVDDVIKIFQEIRQELLKTKRKSLKNAKEIYNLIKPIKMTYR